MPNLADLTDYDPQSVIPEADGIRRVYITGNSSLPVDNTVVNGAPEAVVEIPVSQPSKTSRLVDSVINKLFRDDDQRYQLWPEKVVREALTGAGDVVSGKVPQYEVDQVTGDVHTSPQMIEKAQAISALAGTGGLAGTESGAVLNATPSLRPALKYKDRLYKGKEGQQHMDVIPQNLYPEFQKMAMSGEDISHYNFGFVNDKGHFLTREDALKYGIDNGLIDPAAGKYGALTSTMEVGAKPIDLVKEFIPAVKDTKTNKIYSGDSNSTHPSLQYQNNKFINDKVDGFVNKDGEFLTRKEFRNKFGVDESMDLNDVKSGKYTPKQLTTQLLADSSKPGTAIEAVAKTNPFNTDVFHGTTNNALTELKATRASKKEQMGLKGVHVAEDPAFASIYAGETGNVMPLKAQLGKMLDSTKPVVEGSSEAAFLEDLLKGTGRKPMYMEGVNKGDPKVAPPLHTYIDSVGPNKAEKVLNKHGYDSVKYQAKYGSLGVGGKGMNVSAESPSYLIREPSKLRSKFAQFDPDNFGKNGLLLADSSKEGAALQANKPTFYSAVEHNVGAIPQSKMTGEQWLGTLSNKPGVKPEEMQWTGLQDFLLENKGKPVTKEAIQEHLAANKVELKEVTKGGDATKDQAFALAKEHGWKSWDDIDAATQAKYMARVSKEAGDNPTKYHSYQLPGGENYREKLLTLPTKRKQIGVSEGEFGGMPIVEQTPSQPFKSSHWDEPNIIAHVRMNDRTIDGKNSLHLEEIQSDWHQQGRDRGYKGNAKMSEEEINNVAKQTAESRGINWSSLNNEQRQSYVRSAQRDLEKSAVPDAPFKKNWSELAIKRMLREASENGYDRLSWTAGEHHPTNPKNLKQTGEAAEKADKGMQGFYNDIIPKIVEKLGKEHGVKVKVHEIDKARTYVDQFGKTKHEPAKIYYIDIPQSLRDTAMHKGFPLFSSTHMFTPVSHDPFNEKSK